jgi:hypothetical protein
MASISDLIGKTMLSVEKPDNEQIIFVTTEGERYRLFHDQECCEAVSIEDVIGDLPDLVGAPILMAEEATNSNDPRKCDGDSCTWTFYRLATIKGYVTIRWYGESNGYYSETADFEKCGG